MSAVHEMRYHLQVNHSLWLMIWFQYDMFGYQSVFAAYIHHV